MTVPYRQSSGISPGRDHPLASGPPRLAGQPAMCQAWRPATCVAGLPSCLALFSGAPVCCVDCSGGGGGGRGRGTSVQHAHGTRHQLVALTACTRRAPLAAALVAFSPSVRAWGAARRLVDGAAGSVGLYRPFRRASRIGVCLACTAAPHPVRVRVPRASVVLA